MNTAQTLIYRELIYQGQRSRLSRATSEPSLESVIVKQPSLLSHLPSANNRLLHEYTILKELNIDGVSQPISFQTTERGNTLIFRDNHSINLRAWLTLKRPDYAQRLRTALHIAKILGQIHNARIIHKQITPDNLLINPDTETVTIIDFSLASRLSREYPTLGTPQTHSDNLPYIAPEQTGRINRYIDYRTDYYSFGVTLYELFTGQRPFPQKDNLELLHCHIARQPKAPHLVNPDLPAALSRVILKLLAKDAAQRYQSSYGLYYDLEYCSQIKDTSSTSTFTVGEKDLSERFELPQSLYGRKDTIERLNACFDQATNGQQSLALIAGYAGVGKSSLVHELRQYISQQHGMFAGGKFDQYHRNRPYTAVYQAMQILIRQLLTESDERIQQWRTELQTALGKNAQVILNLIPELSLIIGEQPTAPRLSPSEELHRFSHIFRQMLKVFATAEHPLVLFFDDLQWADLSSLTLLEKLANNPQHPHLLIIGSYRDQDLDQNIAFTHAIHRLKLAPLQVTFVKVEPLTKQDTQQFISDALSHPFEACEPLARISFEKTQGNPFFLNQFLQGLYEEKLIFLEGNRWVWSEEAIRDCEISDNVIDFMVDKIQRLSPQTQAVIQLAACIGNPVALPILAAVYQASIEDTADDLWQALAEGLIFPINTNQLNNQATTHSTRYRFVHDRVQQAAYSLIPQEKIQALHHTIGLIMLERLPEEEQGRRIFDITNHLNQAHSLITAPDERIQLANLNLQAGRRAKEAAAFESAFDYFQTGIDLLPQDSWNSQKQLAIDLHQLAAEAAYIKADFNSLHLLIDAALPYCTRVNDRVHLQELKIQALVATNHFDSALEVALNLLSLLNIKLPEVPSKRVTHQSRLYSLAKLYLTSDERILALPSMTHPEARSAMSILASMFGIVKFSSSGLRPLVMAKEVELTLRHGLCNESAMAFAGYGGVLCGQYQQVDLGYRLGQLALKISKQPEFSRFDHKAESLFSTYIRHYKEPLSVCADALLEAHNKGLETGDIEWSAYSLAAYIQFSILLSTDLDSFSQQVKEYTLQLKESGQKQSLHYSLMALQTVESLRAPKAELNLNGSFYTEEIMLAEHKKHNHKTAICLHYFYKSLLAFLFQHPKEAFAYSEQALSLSVYIGGTYTESFLRYLHALNSLNLLSQLKDAEQLIHIKALENYLKKTDKLALHCPANHEHHQILVKALLLSYQLSYNEAASLFDSAISLAKQSGFHLDFAIANEAAGRCYLRWGKETIAHHYIEQAYMGYSTWGARSKQTLLEREFPHLASAATPKTNTYLAQATPQPEAHKLSDYAYDVASVIKASQAISDEIVLEPLLGRLMGLAIENAGAQRALLLLNRQSLMIEAEAQLEGNTQFYENLTLEAGSHLLPASIIHYVARTKENVVLGHACRHEMFKNDPYIAQQQPLSLLCLPILYHGKLTAMLYLENNQSRDVFDKNRLEALQILSAQAAISIENAKLYQSLEKSEYNYKSLFLNAVEGIFRAAPEGRFISANPALASLLEYPSANHFLDEITDIATQCFYDDQDLFTFMAALNQHQRVLNFETRWLKRSKEPIYVSISARKVNDIQGNLEYYEGSLTDISERKAKEFAERARQKAEAENEAKTRFLATMSHEIRTPMNGILGMAQLLRKGNLQPEQAAQIDTIYNAGQSLLSILNDVLDFSKFESGHITLEEQPFKIDQVLDEAYNLFLPIAQEKSLQLIPRIDRNLPSVRGDRRVLSQILINLLSNAIKFTHAGVISSCMKLLTKTETDLTIRFEITDTGIGISKAAQKTIFRHFTQADSSITRRYGGTGLGLAITKQMIEQQGGKIGVDSHEGNGSCFWFEVSYPIADLPNDTTEHSPQKTIASTIAPLDILLVEDTQVNQAVATGLLEIDGHRVTIADDGYTALSMHNDHAYDLILMDIHLPDMDGVTTAKKIRAHPDPNRAFVRIIALTASVSKQEVDSYLAAGMDDVIAKPIQHERLRRVLSTPYSKAELILNAPAPEGETLLDSSLIQQHLNLLGEERFNQLMEQFQAQARTLLGDLESTSDAHLLAQHAHTLAGAAANFGFHALSAQCKQIENHATTERDNSLNIITLIETSRALFEESVEALSALRLEL
ncbi:AAA family ATPase [Neptunomonas concharum]|uniref:histidine kinase n=1 Tax=Neptunomonas concharum TaxID=1031538 RepID=A0A5P1RAI3_9GAMM|nr:AAA family ATPase [Neptunomonas concharum]QEQ96296.1 AAA family ATPase [Neptunomonas concharum]